MLPFQITGPAWMEGAKFDIAAKLPPDAANAEVPLMLQALLADRFNFEAHQSNKEFPVYLLTVSKGGSKLTPAQRGGARNMANGMSPVSLDSLARVLSRWMDRPVLDRTGMEGEYLVPFEPIAREEMIALQERARSVPGSAADSAREAGGSGIFGVMRSLGLTLESQKVMLPILVVDRVEKRPTEN